MIIYTPVEINLSLRGFGYQLDPFKPNQDNSWERKKDVVKWIRATTCSVLELGEALHDDEFIDVGIRDIRWIYYDGPDCIYAKNGHDGLQYIGIVETEVDDDFFGVASR